MDPILEFPADLTKQEYVAFSAGGNGKARNAYLLLMLAVVVMGVFLAVEEQFSTESLVILAVSVLTTLVTAMGIPLYARQKAAREYDAARRSGYDFYGTVRFYEDRVEKVCGGEINAARYADAAFFENENMMVFAVRGGRALVLPARCLTAADADAVRAIVQAHIPAQRQLLRRMLLPRAVERLAPPPADERPEEQELLRFTAQHSVRSFARQARRQATLRYMRTLPVMLVLDVLLTVLVGVLYGFIPGVALFIAALVVPWLMQTVMTGRRARRAAELQDASALRFEVQVTDRGIRMRVPSIQRNDGFVAWKAVARAVEGRENVDFIGFDKQLLLSFPVETVGDHMPALREVVTEQLRRVKGESHD